MRKIISIFLLLLILLTNVYGFTPYQKPHPGLQINWASPLSRDLVGYWLFNEGSGNIVSDLSGNGYTGTINGNGLWFPGKFGSAISNDGANGSYIALPDIIQLNNASVFTFLIWLKQTTLDQVRYIFSKTKAGDEQIIMETWSNGNLYVQIERPAPNDAYGYFDYSTVVTAGKWFHFAVVFDGSGAANVDRLKVYIDGVSQTLSFTNTIPATTADLSGQTVQIGSSFINQQTWDGGLDSPILYARTLSASEIAELYREPFGMFVKDDIAILATAAVPPPPPTGQVITIIMASIPLFLIPFFFIKRRKLRR